MKYKTRKSYNSPNHCHALTFSCYKQRHFLKNENICRLFINNLIKVKVKHSFNVISFVIMSSHIHLLIKPRNKDYSISSILFDIKQPIAIKVIRYIRKYYPEKKRLFKTDQKWSKYRFWQDGGGFDKNLITDEAVNSMIDYIHNNPVKAGLVKNSWEYKWSSANPKFADIIDPL